MQCHEGGGGVPSSEKEKGFSVADTMEWLDKSPAVTWTVISGLGAALILGFAKVLREATALATAPDRVKQPWERPISG